MFDITGLIILYQNFKNFSIKNFTTSINFIEIVKKCDSS